MSFRIKYVLALSSAVFILIGFLLSYMLYPWYFVYASFIIAVLSSGRWIIPNGLKGLLKGHLGISFLMTVAAFGAIIIGDPAEGAAVMFLFFIAELLEEKSGDRVRKEIEALIHLEPPSVTLKQDGIESCSSPDDVQVGQVYVAKPGERIGLDGEVVQGSSTVNQAPITGESIPVSKSVGDAVFAGTINIDGYLEIKVTKRSKDSVLSRIVELVQEARKGKSSPERFVSRFSHIYTPIVVAGALILGLATFLLGATIEDSVYRGLTLLVVSCPCAFAISIPVSMVSSIAGSAREGVLIKGSNYLESLSRAKIVAFDKTGTLTQGTLSVENICLHNGSSREDILAAAVALEIMSEHPIAQALVSKAKEEGIIVPQARDFLNIPGRGVRGSIGDSNYIIGNRLMLIENNVSIPSEFHDCGNGTLVYVVKDGLHLGTIILGDAIREGTKEALDKLAKLGIKTVMLTGDAESSAHEVAASLGFIDYQAELLPEKKVEHVKLLSATGPTVMVGDGVNDTPALAAADVGIAMGVISSDAALETADIALMDQDLRRIPRLISRSKKTMQIVRQNVAISISVKILIGILAIFGAVTLWIAIAIGDMGLTLLVIANALRLARKGK